MESIGTVISQTRKSKGLTQEELAELSQVNLRTIQRIEKNENIPRGRTLNLICKVLNLDIDEIQIKPKSKRNQIVNLIVNGFFLIVLNIVVMGIIGFLTFDSGSTINSKFGGFLLSFFIPFFIVSKTQNMSSIERLLKFGIGLIIYFIVVLFKHGFPAGFISGLFVCQVLFLCVLFYGDILIINKK